MGLSVLAGFKRATGIELNQTRLDYSMTKLNRFMKLFPCMGERLQFAQGTIVNETDWSLGTDPRVIFMDATAFDELWPRISHLFSSSDLGSDTVVAVVGRSRLGIADEIDEITVPVSGPTDASTETVHFFTKNEAKKILNKEDSTAGQDRKDDGTDEEAEERKANLTDANLENLTRRISQLANVNLTYHKGEAHKHAS